MILFGRPKRTQSRSHGDRDTIHNTSELNIELSPTCEVVAVWFRRQALPFTQNTVSRDRAQQMRELYNTSHPPEIIALDLADPTGGV